MNHPRMTSSGRRWAALIGIVFALSLPKHVERGHRVDTLGNQCTRYEVKPLGFSLVEDLVGREVGFAYSSGEECR